MPATATLRGLVHAEYAYLLLIDNVETAFTDDARLTTTTFTGADGHDIVLGLDTRGLELPESLNPRSGQPERDVVTFTIDDFDRAGVLPDLFRAIDPFQEPLAFSIFPNTDLSSITQVHGNNVGTERMGTSGERHRFPCVSGFQVGDMHIGQDQELPHHRPAAVTRDPLLWRGRRCALYRCYFDLDGTRRPYSEADRVWWGTITDSGFVNGRQWKIEVEGWGSWLRKEVGVLTQTDPVPALGALTLSTAAGADESRIGIRLRRQDAWVEANNEEYGVRQFTGQITSTTTLNIISDISSEFTTAEATAGGGGVALEDGQNRWISIDSTGKIGVHIDDTGGEQRVDFLLVMHRKVWARIGYDVDQQAALADNDQYYLNFYSYDDYPSSDIGDAPGSGYYAAGMSTVDPASGDYDNGGNPRYYFPYYPGGTTTFLAGLNNGEGQVVDLGDGFGSNIVYHRGQLSRPVASDPADPTSPASLTVGDCNRQGLWLIYGKRRDGDREWDEYWVARASWRSGALAQQGQVLGGQILVTEWLRPRSFGFDRKKPQFDWNIRSNSEPDYRAFAVPILALDYRASDARERADVVLERLLRTTGTSTGWSSYLADPTATLDGGDNDSAGIVRRDAEYADYGLRIPGSMVANLLTFALVYDALPGKLGDIKLAFSPGTPTEKIAESLTRPFGLSWTLRGGVYGVDDPFSTPSPLDIDHVLDQSNKMGAMQPDRELETGQELRALAPIDKFEIHYDWAPHLNRFGKTYSVQSPDPGRRYRQGGVVDTIEALGLRELDGFADRMRDVGNWWARRHFIVHDRPHMGRTPVHVGEFVRLTDPRGVNPEGTYGITLMIGRVIGVRTIARPEDGEPHAYLTILVYANTASTPRLHAMSAEAFGIDTDNDRIYTRSNWLGFYGAPWPGDASYFTEPSLPGITAVGGDMEVTIIQWDGAWRTAVTGRQVTAVGSDDVGDYVELDASPSEYYHRMRTVLIAAPRGTLAAQWALDYYGVICAEDGEFGATAGFAFEDLT